MRSVMCAVATVLLAIPASAFPENPPDVRVLATRDVKFNFDKLGSGPKPVELMSVEELGKSNLFTDDAGRELIAKQVDFANEKLVVFVWGGSGGDKLVGTPVKRDGTAQFTYTAGFTDDFRRHAHVFAVPKDAKVEMAK